MATLREWFDDFSSETGEKPETVMLEWDEWDDSYRSEGWPALPPGIIAFSDLSPEILDRQFSDGYGGTESPNLAAWSESYVIGTCCYDGAEWMFYIPRNPTTHHPCRPGGG